MDRLISNYAFLEDSLIRIKELKDKIPLYFMNSVWSTKRYGTEPNETRRVIVKNPYIALLACEHIVSDIQCYAKMHSIEMRPFKVSGDLSCDSLPLLDRWKVNFGNVNILPKKLNFNGNAMDVDLNEEAMDVDSDIQINTEGRLQKIILFPGPVLNLSGVAATKYSGPYQKLAGCAFGRGSKDLRQVVSILAEKGICKIRYLTIY